MSLVVGSWTGWSTARDLWWSTDYRLITMIMKIDWRLIDDQLDVCGGAKPNCDPVHYYHCCLCIGCWQFVSDTSGFISLNISLLQWCGAYASRNDLRLLLIYKCNNCSILEFLQGTINGKFNQKSIKVAPNHY